ncbi:MAG: extracellular solute-binding protein [Atribacterota bacterium]|nr:extracellular solute-binding protein [Atribacterota bacterium]MDI9595202.1 extracellular solute-binding protein [Atribacterota bacterium]
MKKALVLFVSLLVLTLFTTAFAETMVSNPDWWKKAGEPYKGVTIKGISESTPPSKAAMEVAAPQFEELTGIKVVFEVTSWDEMYNKAIQDMQTGSGIYDFVYVEQDIVYSYLPQNWLTNLTPFMNNPAITDPGFDLADFTSFIDNFKDREGNIYGIPFEAFLKSYVYRTDLFGDPEIQAAYKAKYNKDLAVPTNWEDYTNIAKFFTEYGKEKGIELYGHIAQAKTHPCVAYEICETIWPAMGIYNWGINLENMRATKANGGLVDSDEAKAAFKWYVDMLQWAPPGVKTYTWDETAATFGAGKVAQGIIYLENLGWWSDPAQSEVAGKISVALPPVTEKALADAKSGAGYIGYYDGGALGIPHSSKNKEAAWLFAQWVARKEWQGEFAKLGTRVVRNSTFEDPIVIELDPQMGNYFTFLKEQGPLFRGAPALPMHRPLNDLYLKWVSKAVAGEISPDEALDNLAKETDELMEELGY